MPSFVRSLRRPGLWLGFLGSLLIVAGAYALPGTPAPFAELAGGYWRHVEPNGRHLLVLGVTLTCVAFWRIRPANPHGAVHPWAAFALWVLPYLGSVPIMSPDLLSYLDYAWQTQQGVDPYRAGLGTVAGPFQALADPFWHGVIAVYPALDLRVYAALGAAAGFHVIPAVLLARLPALAGAVALGLCLSPLARRAGVDPHRALWFGLLNPVTLITGVGGAHNDLFMVGLLAVALAASLLPHGWIWCALLSGLAAGIKQPGLIGALIGAMLATRVAGWGRRLLTAAAAVALALAVLVGSSYALGLGMGWIHGLSVPGTWVSFSLVSVVSYFNWLFFGPSSGMRFVALAGQLGTVLIAAWALWRRWERPFVAGAWILLAYSLLGQAMHAWYLIVVFLFVALVPLGRSARAFLAGLIAYVLVGAVLTQGYRVDGLSGVFLGLAAGLVIAWLWLHHRELRGWLRVEQAMRPDGTPVGAVPAPVDAIAPHDPVTGEVQA